MSKNKEYTKLCYTYIKSLERRFNMFLKNKVHVLKKVHNEYELPLRLIDSLSKFKNGLDLIQYHIMSGQLESEVLEDIINGGKEAQDAYCDCFCLSFDAEPSEIEGVISCLIEYLGLNINTEKAEEIYASHFHPYDSTFLGFKKTNEAISELLYICENNEYLDKTIKDIHNIYKVGYTYSPFKEGINIFKEKFNEFEKYYLAELKDAIGEEKYNVHESYIDSNYVKINKIAIIVKEQLFN
jgi:hypothetical protein